MNRLMKIITDIFFPNRCPFCDGFIKWDRLVCEKCENELPFTGKELCEKCGKSPCECSELLNYDRVYSVCYYKDKAKKSVLDLKNSNSSNSAEYFASILYEKILAGDIKYDYIVPVPMSKSKKRKRGYNQAEEIAVKLSERTGIPVSDSFIYKIENESEQHSLNEKERSEYVKIIFFCNDKAEIKGKKVLLCDDVFTTGSTVSYCSYLLKKLGAEYIGVVVAAVTERHYKQ